MEGLLAVLDLWGRDARKAERRLRGVHAIWLLLFVVFFVAAIWAAIEALQYGWETGQWGVEYQTKLLDFILIPVQCLIPWLRVVMWPLVRPTPHQLTAGAAALRASAAQDARDIVVASDVLGALDGIAVPAVPAAFGSFRRPNRALRFDDLALGACLILIGMSLASLVVVLLVATPQSASWPRVVTLGGAGVGLALCAAGAALLAEAQRLGHRVRIYADEMGLRWERVFPRRGEVRVAWDAIRAIFVISHTRGLNRHLACVVDGGGAVLAFDLSSKSASGEVIEANRLVKLVLARTDLPLLDQTKLAENLCARRYSPQYRAAYEALTRPSAASRASAVRLPRPLAARQIKWAVASWLLPLLLIPGCVLSGIGMQHYQQAEYTALLAEARAHTPIYQDALSAPDTDWQAHGPSSGDPNSYTFAHGGYLITPVSSASSDSNQQNSPFVEVYAPGMYHDAVVEVTLRMAPGGVPYGSAALALHALSGNIGDNLHFGINGDGSWGALDFAHCPPSPTGPDDSTCSYDSSDQASAIHHADWAPNRLTAILRGNQVICFINDVYVGSVVDLGPQSGRLGFGVEGLGVPVVFSDFTIYPL